MTALFDTRICDLGEGPFWHPDRQQLFWFDILGKRLLTQSPDGPQGIKAIRAVLPCMTQVYAVGGAGPDNFAEWIAAGVDGFGLGTALYTPGLTVAEIATRAATIVAAYEAATA